MGDPRAVKRQKMDNFALRPIFQSFLSDGDKKIDLGVTLAALKWGLEDLTLGALKVETCNARETVSFSDATIQTSPQSFEDAGDVSVVKGVPVGEVFLYGVDVLGNYLDKEQPKISTNPKHQQALARLLTFLTSSKDHSALLEQQDSEVKWSVTLAQHLLSKLAVDNSYTIDSYQGFKQGFTNCPCKVKDELVGKLGDTSYGSLKGWHGKADIIMEEELPVFVFPGGDNNDNNSVSSVKARDNILKKDVNRILAQTIVFSFLQQKLKKGELDNYLIPGVGITSKYLIVCFFDTENDVLLQSKPIKLFRGKSINTFAVLFLWLTLNYRMFCSGCYSEMKERSSGFIVNIGDHLHIYKDEVRRPVHVPHTQQEALFPWVRKPKWHAQLYETSSSIAYENLPLCPDADDSGN